MNSHLGLSDFYLECARGYIPGAITVHKFGLAEDIDTGDGEVDIWDGSSNNVGGKISPYNWADGAVITHISSTDGGDDHTIAIQGLDEDWNIISYDVVLNGQSPVVLSVPLRRFFRGFNRSATEFSGFLYIHEGGSLSGGKPDDDTEVYGIIHPENQQTEMALFTVPAGYSLYILHGWAHISKSSTTEAIVRVYRRDFEGVFRVLHTLALQTSGSSGDQRPYKVPLVLEEKSDIIYRANAYSNSTAVSAGFHGILLPNNSRN